MGLFDDIDFANSQYISNNVGLPLEEIAKTGEIVQGRYDQNLAKLDQLDLMLSNDRYLENDSAIGEQIRNSLRSQIDQIASGELENADRKIATLAKNFVGDNLRTTALENYAAVQEANKLRTQYGSSALDFNPASNFSSLSGGQLQRFNHGIEKKLDYDSKKESFFDGMLQDVSEGKIGQSDIEGLLQTKTYRGISGNKIARYLDSAYRRYIDSNEFQQEFRKLTEIDGLPPEQAEAYIKDSILKAGQERIGGGFTTNTFRDPSFTPKVSPEQANRFTSSMRIPITENTNVFQLPDSILAASFDKDGNATYDKPGRGKGFLGETIVYFDKDGNEVPEAKATHPKQGGLKKGFTSKTINPSDVSNKLSEEIQNIKHTELLKFDNIQDNEGKYNKRKEELSALTDKQTAELMKDVQKKLTKINLNQANLNKDLRDLKTAQIFGESGIAELDQRAIAVIGEGNTLEGGDFGSVMKELGYLSTGFLGFGSENINTEAFKDAEITAVVPNTPFGDVYAGSYVASIKDANGRPRKLLIQGNNEDREAYALTNVLQEALYRNTTVNVSQNGVNYRATPIINPEKREMELIIQFENPETGEIIGTTLDVLNGIEQSNYANSGVFGSNVFKTKNASVE